MGVIEHILDPKPVPPAKWIRIPFWAVWKGQYYQPLKGGDLHKKTEEKKQNTNFSQPPGLVNLQVKSSSWVGVSLPAALCSRPACVIYLVLGWFFRKSVIDLIKNIQIIF